MIIIKCENGVGEWEISPLGETFDTKQEAQKRIDELMIGVPSEIYVG